MKKIIIVIFAISLFTLIIVFNSIKKETNNLGKEISSLKHQNDQISQQIKDALLINNFEENNNSAPEKLLSKDELKFDIDLKKLAYKLPSYTKICIPEKKYFCTNFENKNCEQVKASIFVLYDDNNNKICRCDNKPCDCFNILSENSGLYKNITPVKPNGTMYKISNIGEYIEIVSLGLDTYLSQGNCFDKLN